MVNIASENKYTFGEGLLVIFIALSVMLGIGSVLHGTEKQGYAEGYEQAKVDFYDQYYEEGYEEGRDVGYEEGWEECADLTWEECYDGAYTFGYERGWSDSEGGGEYDDTPIGEYEY